MGFFTFLGQEDFFFLVMPALLWCVDSQLGLRVGVYLALSAGMNSLFKFAFHAPRPYWVDGGVRLLGGAESSFGMPSGHAQNAVVVWGMLAAHLRRKWGWVVAGLLIFFIGVSRI
jgi:membrane-associated phospholipid phosphatase